MRINDTTSSALRSWPISAWSKQKAGAGPVQQMTVFLLAIYAFLVPLGNITRFSDEETSLGATTFILLTIIILMIKAATQAVRLHRVLFSIALLILWMAFTSVFADDVPEAYFNLAMFAAYFMAASGVYGMALTSTRIYRLLQLFVIGGLISSAATIVDWVGIINIPHVNKLELGTATEYGYILQASGPFSRRSGMAAYYALIIPIAFLMPLFVKGIGKLQRIAFYVTAIACSIALMLTHNRAGILGSLISILVILALTNKSPSGLIRTSLIGLVFVAGIYSLVAIFFPDVLVAYEASSGIGDVASADRFQEESDELRVVFLQYAFSSLLSNPFGHGYTPLTMAAGFYEVDPHNIVTQIIWAAGIIGIAWLGYFCFEVQRMGKIILSKQRRNNTHAQLGIAIVGGLFSFFLVGMAHSIILTGVAWILLGLVLRITSILLEEKKC